MKRMAAVLVMMCAASSMFAAGRRSSMLSRALGPAPEGWKVEIVPNGRQVALETMANLEALEKRDRLSVSSVIDNRADRALVIPAVGSVRGAGGTFFRSDITLVNYNDTNQRVQFVFLPSGNPGGTIVAIGNIPGGRPPFTIADFVGTQLNQSALGALLILPLQAGSNTNPDDNAAIDAYSRIYTPQPNTTRGTVSLPFAPVSPTHLFAEYEAILLGLRIDADFRTNFGIVNLSPAVTLPFVVTVIPETPGVGSIQISLSLPPLSMVQQGISGSPANGQVNILVNVNADIPRDEFFWTAYASSNDNTTGDGYVSIASIPLDDEGLDEIEDR